VITAGCCRCRWWGGAALLLAADVLARVLIARAGTAGSGRHSPGGAPFFLWILRRSRQASYGGEMLEIVDLSVGYGTRRLSCSKGISSLQPGEILAVIGPNGAGKSTWCAR